MLTRISEGDSAGKLIQNTMAASETMAHQLDSQGMDSLSFKRRLTRLVIAFRRALEAHAREYRQGPWRDFPRGRCKHSCLLLARYLKEAGLGEADLVANAVLDDDATTRHAWLILSDLIIDITADQFGEKPVIVAEDSSFHNHFRGHGRYPYAKYMNLNAYHKDKHLAVYRDVLRRLSQVTAP